MSGPSESQTIAVSVVGTSAIICAHATTVPVSLSRSDPSSGGMGAGGISLMNAAASRSLALGKWRYSVALATLELRVTASMVTALGPPERSSAVAASSSRARERAGRGSVLTVAIVYRTSNANETIGLGSRLLVSKMSLEGSDANHRHPRTIRQGYRRRRHQTLETRTLVASHRRRALRVVGDLIDGGAQRG